MNEKEKNESQIYKGYQIMIPRNIQKKVPMEINDEIIWKIKNKNKISIKIKKQRSLNEFEKFSI